MSPQGAKKWAKEIQAFAEGKTMQVRIPGEEWHDCCGDCGFHDSREYRIKPEPRKLFCIFEGDIHQSTYNNLGAAKACVDRNPQHPFRIVEFVEVS